MAKKLKGFSLIGSLITSIIFSSIEIVCLVVNALLKDSLNHLEGIQGIAAIAIVAVMAVILIVGIALVIPTVFVILPGSIVKYKINEEKPIKLLVPIIIFSSLAILAFFANIFVLIFLKK